MFSRSKPSGSEVTTPNALIPTLRGEKRRRFARKALKGSLCLFAITVVIHLSVGIYASVQLNRELAAIRQKGEPVRFSELEPPPVPDSQNAALVYAQAKKALQITPNDKATLRTREDRLGPQQLQLVDQIVLKNQEALELARRASAMPQCRFPVNWKGNPIAMTFPHYSDLREIARLMAFDARSKARRGDKEGALRDVRAVFGMARHLGAEPVFIGFLVAQAVNETAHRSLAKVLEVVPLSVAEARAFEASLPQEDWVKSFRRTQLGERAFGLYAFESLGQKPVGYMEDSSDYIPVWAKYPLLSLAKPLIKLDEVQTLHMWRNMLNSPQSQQVPTPAGFDVSLDKSLDNAPFYAVLTRILYPVFSRANTIRDKSYIRQRQSEVALALACYHTSNGKYPARLQDAEALWGKPFPLDFYSQKSFVYKPTGKSFLLYSIGPNRTDDKGKTPNSPGLASRTADDIVWGGW